MKKQKNALMYFPHGIQISAQFLRSHDLETSANAPEIVFFRQLARALNLEQPSEFPLVNTGSLYLYASMQSVFRFLADMALGQFSHKNFDYALRKNGVDPIGQLVRSVSSNFVKFFPPALKYDGARHENCCLDNIKSNSDVRYVVLRELLLLRFASENPAIASFRRILDDSELMATCGEEYLTVVSAMTKTLTDSPRLPGFAMTLPDLLRAPVKVSPDSLEDQAMLIRDEWAALLPEELRKKLVSAFDILLEENYERARGGDGPGPTRVLEFGKSANSVATPDILEVALLSDGYNYPEYECFSRDDNWMTNVVMVAKMVYIWLDQLSRRYGYPINTLDQTPDAELDRLADAGFTAIWLIGVWERSPASRRIKQLCGNNDAIASAYSLYDYEIAHDLGGWEALSNLRERAFKRGIRLASDMVPNHTGVCSRWVFEHPDWFIQTDYLPFPSYQFNGKNLSSDERAVVQIEDGYWTRSDAAVVFRFIERDSGNVRYIYHGNDGTSFPWNDTAQLNFLLPDVREAVIQIILNVAHNFPIIRFDAAMTLAKKHFQRLWYPIPGLAGGIPSRSEHGMSREEFDALFPVEFWREVVDRVAAEAPDTLLLAEAFWLMEGYFVRTLGMHRVYNSAFMNMLLDEENVKYRQTVKNVLEFDPEILKRFVNFMSNPDEKTAVEQFGTQDKYFGCCVMMATMPGLPMFAHGQLEGWREKYGMEYRRAYWNESVDEDLMRGHRMWIFPLLRLRGLFSGSEHFALYDFISDNGVDENVFAYSNRAGEQCALVFYHNRHALSAGWIRDAAPIAIKRDDCEPSARRTTLAENLGLIPDRGVFYAFREISSGLEFIRSGHEIADKGIYAELGEYEFQVFIDFREIRDDEECSWEIICKTLCGRGAKNLESEHKRIRFAELNASFRALLQAIPDTSTDAKLCVQTLDKALESFLSALKEQSGNIEKASARWAAEAIALFSLLTRLKSYSPHSRHAVDFLTVIRKRVASVSGARLLLSWLLLRDSAPDCLDRFALDYTLREFMEDALDDDPVGLLKALLARFSQGKEAESPHDIFVIPDCRHYLLVHDSNGTNWFNKERFESLTIWILIVKFCDSLLKQTASHEPASWHVASSRHEMRRLAKLAEKAGYRTEMFIDLMKSSTQPTRQKPKKTPPRSA